MSIGLLLTFSLYWGAAGVTLAAPVLVTLGLDVFRQSQQVSLATRIFMLDDGLRSRLNACAMFSICIGQTIGSAAGSKVFLDYGWRANGALMVAFCGCQLFVLLVRGPHAERYTWFGYEGGLEWRRERPSPVQDAEKYGTKYGEEGSGEQTRAPSLEGDEKDVVSEEDKGPLSESQTRAPTPTPEILEEKNGERM